MKTFPAVIFLLLSLMCFNCKQDHSGELVEPPEGMERAIKENLAARNCELKGFSVRDRGDGSFLVTADTNYIGQSDPKSAPAPRINPVVMIIEKGYRGEATYWQVSFTTH